MLYLFIAPKIHTIESVIIIISNWTFQKIPQKEISVGRHLDNFWSVMRYKYVYGRNHLFAGTIKAVTK